MEDIITYIVVFGLIISAVAIWQIRRSKARPYILSTQLFPDCKLEVIIRKHEGKTRDLFIEITAIKHISLTEIYVELISKTRDFTTFYDALHKAEIEYPVKLQPNQSAIFKYDFTQFKKSITSSKIPFKTFRVAVTVESSRKFKSHDLAFNKNWVIYRPDSGTYN